MTPRYVVGVHIKMKLNNINLIMYFELIEIIKKYDLSILSYLNLFVNEFS